MVRKDYDAASKAASRIQVRIGELDLDFPGDAPIAMAMEWYERQTSTAEEIGESSRVYAETNYRLVTSAAEYTPEILDAIDGLYEDEKFVAGLEDGPGSAEIYDVLRFRGVGQRSIDDLYRDLLDEWGLWPRPKEQDTLAAQILGRLRVIAQVEPFDGERALRLIDELGTLLGYEVAAVEIDTEEETASETVGGDPGNV